MAAIMPFSVIGSVDDVTTPDGRVVKGREYLWGVAEGAYIFCDEFAELTRSRESGALRFYQAPQSAHPKLHAGPHHQHRGEPL
jgi:hypothetical protein